MAESLTPTKAGRDSPDTSQVPSTQATVPEEFVRFYKKPLQVEVDVTTLVIDKQKKNGQIRKYSQKRVDEVKRSLLANPPEEPVTMPAWQSQGTYRVVEAISHVRGLKNIFLSSADDWIVMVKQHFAATRTP